MPGQAHRDARGSRPGPVPCLQAPLARWRGPRGARPSRRQHREVHPLQAPAESPSATVGRLPLAGNYPDGAVPRGMTALRLLLAGTCVATVGIAYSIAHPKTKAAQEVGSRPVRVIEEQTYKAPRLGRASKLPPLAPPPRAAPDPTRVERAKPVRSVPANRPRRGAQTSAPPVAPAAPVNTPAPVKTPAPPPPPPTPVYEPPPPPRPAPPTPEPDLVTFDDSG